jgi:glutathione synthase/RimK-type ligase-like ATP-grasp enzyme
MRQIADCGCNAFLVWPDGFLSVWGRMVKDRVMVIERDLKLPVFPSSNEIWPFEDKRRMAYWLRSHEMPHPRTWIFYDLAECEGFVASCQMPIVYKADFGASASGVRVFRDRRRLRRFVRRVFSSGFVPRGFDRRDRQWGSVLLQEYLPNIREWRMVRIGDSFFGHGKGRAGKFASGSGVVDWTVPEPRHLDFLERVTHAGSFRSMNVDVFERPDGTLLVNELQAVFGAGYAFDQLRVDGKPGRFVRGAQAGEWRFEEGDFARNACANERIRWVIRSRGVAEVSQ